MTLTVFRCARCGKPDARAPWVLRRCRERHGVSLCKRCQDIVEKGVER
jgi:NAD-dependent SIR2 family protein deacetylase